MLIEQLSDREKIMAQQVATVLEKMYPSGELAFPMFVKVLPALVEVFQQVIDEETAARVVH